MMSDFGSRPASLKMESIKAEASAGRQEEFVAESSKHFVIDREGGGYRSIDETIYVPPPIDDSLHHLPTISMYCQVNIECANEVPTFEEMKHGIMSVNCEVPVRFGDAVIFRPISTRLLDCHRLVLKARTQVYVSDHGDIMSGRTKGGDNKLYVKCQTSWCPVDEREGKYLTFDILSDDATWKKGTVKEKRNRSKLFVHHCVIYTFQGGKPKTSEDDIDIFWSVDHINRDSTDNRFINLRWGTSFEQANNRSTSLKVSTEVVTDSRPRCSVDGCNKPAKRGPLCADHKLKCTVDGCNRAAQQGGICKTHGGKQIVKICSTEGCPNGAKRGGKCYQHGAKRQMCTSNGCTNQANYGGKCVSHGAVRKRCLVEDCEKQAIVRGFCSAHGGRPETRICIVVGCGKVANRAGRLCRGHA